LKQKLKLNNKIHKIILLMLLNHLTL